MGGDSRREYLRAIRQRYSEASREEKSVILQEFCAVCSYHRKHTIRLLNGRRSVAKGKPGRKPVYHSTELLRALKRIWLVTVQHEITAFPQSLVKTSLGSPFFPLTGHTDWRNVIGCETFHNIFAS